MKLYQKLKIHDFVISRTREISDCRCFRFLTALRCVRNDTFDTASWYGFTKVLILTKSLHQPLQACGQTGIVGLLHPLAHHIFLLQRHR